MPSSVSRFLFRGLSRFAVLLVLFGLSTVSVQAQDADGDGLDDAFETALGMDPQSADADGDGDDDWLEYYRCRNPLSASDRGAHRCSVGSPPGTPIGERGVVWSENGPIAGMSCTRFVGASDAALWPNTYLCLRPFLGLRWSTSGPIPGMTCLIVQNVLDPAWSGTNHQLCRVPSREGTNPAGGGTNFEGWPSDVVVWTISATPPFAAQHCAQITNANKSSGWNNMFFCFKDTLFAFESATCVNCDTDDVAAGPVLDIRETDPAGQAGPGNTFPARFNVSGQTCTGIDGQPGRCRLPAAPFAQLGGRHLLRNPNEYSVAFAFRPPRLDAVTPSTGVSPGTTLTLDGVRFGYGTPVVTVGGVQCAIQPPVRNTRIQCTVPVVPPGPASVSVLVGGQLSNARVINIVLPPPTIDTVQPVGAVPTEGGGVLRVTGTNLDVHPVTIQVGSVACPLIPAAASATEQRCTIPAGLGRAVAVRVDVGALRRDTTLDYDAPVIDSIEGQGGPTAGGTTIRLIGRNFGSNAFAFTALVGNASCAPVVSINHQQAQCVLPAGRGAAVPVQVVVAGQPSNERPYRYGSPVVSAVGGQGGATVGGSAVTISGSNFGANAADLVATIGGRTCSVATGGGTVSHGQITCVLPAGQGGAEAVRVVVAGQPSNVDRTYAYAQPVLGSVLGAGGPTSGGPRISLAGNHFGVDRAAFSATIDGRACTVPADAPFSHTATECVLPPGEGGAAQVRLSVGGQPSNVLPYAYAPPRIDSVAGQDGPTAGGSVVILTGVNFGLGGAALVARVGGQPCLTAVPGGGVTHDEVRCILPAGQGEAVPIEVTVAGQPSNVATYRYAAPRIDSIVGQGGSTEGGSLIELQGANFGLGGPGLQITVGTSSCLIPVGQAPSHTLLRCTLPPGQGAAVPVQVRVDTRQSNTSLYRYGAPRIDEVRDQGGPTAGGSLVTLVGANFGSGTPQATVTIGTVACTFDGVGASISHTQLRCRLPAGQGAAVPVAVELDGQPSNLRTYRYAAPVASIPAGTRLRTSGGEDLLISGSNLGLSARITIDGAPCASGEQSHSVVRCTTPPGSGQGRPLVVDIGGQRAELTVDYRAPAISSFTPASGPTAGGATLTLTGSDFGASALARPRTVTVGGVDCPIAEADHGRITCTLPPGEGIARALLVEVDGQRSNTPGFSYQPPLLRDLSPGAMPVQGGLDLEVVGTNLGVAPTVTVDALPCPLLPGGQAHQRVRCRAPARTSGTGLVRVDVGGQSSNPLPLDYDAAPLAITVGKAGSGGGTVSANRLGLSCDADCILREGLVPAGAQVELTATALPGSRLLRWQGACSGTAPLCRFVATSDANAVAVFEERLFGSDFEPGEAP